MHIESKRAYSALYLNLNFECSLERESLKLLQSHIRLKYQIDTKAVGLICKKVG